MHRQFVDTETVRREIVDLPRAESRHFVNVLRLKEGECVELFDGRGASASFEIRSASRNGVTLARTGDVRIAARPRTGVILGACISKGKRMDWTVEKAVELGVSAVLPIISDYSVVRLENEEAGGKRERWLRVAADAARQCGAPYIPEILEPMPFGEACAYISANSEVSFAGALADGARPFRIVLDELRASGITAPSAAAWLVGPEGDFSAAEYGALREAGVKFVSLGSLVLRTETAAMYGLCILNSEWLA